ncbi:hypothetical protein L7F22_008432 [Adiantum nelumboides]|nr:hypothetical protein [Adiantum nelumboides]
MTATNVCLQTRSAYCPHVPISAAASRGDGQVPANNSTLETLPTEADEVVPAAALHDEEAIINTFRGSLIEPTLLLKQKPNLMQKPLKTKSN